MKPIYSSGQRGAAKEARRQLKPLIDALTKAPVPTEHEEHKSLAAELDLIERRTPGFWWSTIKHGQRLRIGQARAAKREGTKPGVPDILIVYRGRPFFIELKRKKLATVRDYQRETHAAITLAGAAVFVAKGAQAAVDFVRDSVIANAGRLGHGL